MNRTKYVSFSKARAYVRSLKFRSVTEYWSWCSGQIKKRKEKPNSIPSNPHQVYKDEWTSFSDYLGTGRVANFNRSFLCFHEAREFARSLNLSSLKDWREYCSGAIKIPSLSPRPLYIPSNPNFTYKTKGWAGYKDWLGTGLPTLPDISKFKPLEEAKLFAQSLRLNGWLEWREYVSGKLKNKGSLPTDIPAVPHAAYRSSGWISYADWLGTDNVAFHQITFRPYREACDFVAELGIANQFEWRRYCRGEYGNLEHKPTDIPSNPDKVYTSSQFSWNEWFGRHRAIP